jgi:hypothetical protein
VSDRASYSALADMSRFETWTIDDIPALAGLPPINPVPLDARPRDDEPVGGGQHGLHLKGGQGVAAAPGVLAFDIRTTSQAAAQAALDKHDAD